MTRPKGGVVIASVSESAGKAGHPLAKAEAVTVRCAGGESWQSQAA